MAIDLEGKGTRAVDRVVAPFGAQRIGIPRRHRYSRVEVRRRVAAGAVSLQVCLRSSDHAAPGFWLSLLCVRGGGVFASRGDFREPGLSFRMNRETEGIEEGLWLMGLVTHSRVGLTMPIVAEWKKKPKQLDCWVVTPQRLCRRERTDGDVVPVRISE